MGLRRGTEWGRGLTYKGREGRAPTSKRDGREERGIKGTEIKQKEIPPERQGQ